MRRARVGGETEPPSVGGARPQSPLIPHRPIPPPALLARNNPNNPDNKTCSPLPNKEGALVNKEGLLLNKVSSLSLCLAPCCVFWWGSRGSELPVPRRAACAQTHPLAPPPRHATPTALHSLIHHSNNAPDNTTQQQHHTPDQKKKRQSKTRTGLQRDPAADRPHPHHPVQPRPRLGRRPAGLLVPRHPRRQGRQGQGL